MGNGGRHLGQLQPARPLTQRDLEEHRRAVKAERDAIRQKAREEEEAHDREVAAQRAAYEGAPGRGGG
jgi:hypothetical protein